MDLFETTLRDGEQAAGIHLTPAQKAHLAAQLEASGVDVIDAGFPFASAVDWQGVREVAAATETVRVSAVATHLKTDIDAVRRALTGHEDRARLATRIGPEELYKKHESNNQIRGRLIERSTASVSYARCYFPEVQYYLNYSGNRSPEFLEELSDAVVEAGATHVIVADSQSTFTPSKIAILVERLVATLGNRANLGVHCHNNYGLALANTVSAVEAGARQVEVTIGGIGDAGGNTALEQVAAYADNFGDDDPRWQNGFDLGSVMLLADMLRTMTGVTYASNQPFIGEDTFKVEAGIHQNQLEQVALGFDPQRMGRACEVVLGRHSGMIGIRQRAQMLGLWRDGINQKKLYRLLMDKAMETGTISDETLATAVKRVAE